MDPHGDRAMRVAWFVRTLAVIAAFALPIFGASYRIVDFQTHVISTTKSEQVMLREFDRALNLLGASLNLYDQLAILQPRSASAIQTSVFAVDREFATLGSSEPYGRYTPPTRRR